MRYLKTSEAAALLNIGLDPELMLSLAISACMVIYSVLSRLFTVSVFRTQRPLRPSLKDWINVNAIAVTAGMAYSLYSLWAKILDPVLVKKLLDALNAQMNEAYGGKAAPATAGMLDSVAVFFSALLLGAIAHCVWTLFLVKKYKEYFK